MSTSGPILEIEWTDEDLLKLATNAGAEIEPDDLADFLEEEADDLLEAIREFGDEELAEKLIAFHNARNSEDSSNDDE